MTTPGGLRLPSLVRSVDRQRLTAKKRAQAATRTASSASPLLRSRRKRPADTETAEGEPSPKRMAEQVILEAIGGLKGTIKAMDEKLVRFSTKEDLQIIANSVANTLGEHSKKIQKLYDLRQQDSVELAGKVEMVVDKHLVRIAKTGIVAPTPLEQAKEQDYLNCRRSARIWPVPSCADLDMGVRKFLDESLRVPAPVVDGLSFDLLRREEQTRRSQRTDEVLIRFDSSTNRDLVQFYAPNLARMNGQAGLRLEIPEHLKGLFKLFEGHIANLRESTKRQIKRSIKYDDSNQSLLMDLKMEGSDQWHRLHESDIRVVHQRRLAKPDSPSKITGERRQILLLPAVTDLSVDQRSLVVVPAESQGDEEPIQHNTSTFGVVHSPRRRT